MSPNQKSDFLKLLTRTMGAYSKPLPETGLLAVWWDLLVPFPLSVVSAAMSAYCDAEAAFAPAPAAIRKRCIESDGRPSDEEAWAIALPSIDEANTVVWTQEIAAAFEICRPVIESSGAISARKAFLEAYARLVLEARKAQRPAVWDASLGWDIRRRNDALRKAHTANLLPAPVIAVLLPAPAQTGEAVREKFPEGLAKLKEMMSTLTPLSEKIQLKREAENSAQRQADLERKKQLQAQVDTFPAYPAPLGKEKESQ